MVIPPVVVSAGVPDRAVITAAVLIETAMRPMRDTGEILLNLTARVEASATAVNPRCARFLRVSSCRRV